MHERQLAYPQDRRGTRRGTSPAGTVRYALEWVAATTAIVIALSIALPGTRDPAASLVSAVERASCRLEPGGGESAAETRAALDGDTIVVRYRATLSGAERARLGRIVRRLPGRAVTVRGAPASAAAVEASDDAYRLGCPRVNQRT
jgi:hypothetical protein